MTELPYIQEATTNLHAICGETLVGCVYCCSIYKGVKTDFHTCYDNDVKETLICNRCNVDAVVPVVEGSQLFGLSQDDILDKMTEWRKEGILSLRLWKKGSYLPLGSPWSVARRGNKYI